MSNKIERLSKARRMLLMTGAILFLVWQVPMLDRSERIAADAASVMDVVSLVGFLGWAAILIYLIGPWSRMSRDKSVQAALNDELVKDNRKRAFTAGYVAMMLGTGSLYALSMFVPVKGVEAAHIVLVIGVIAPMFAFARLERQGG